MVSVKWVVMWDMATTEVPLLNRGAFLKMMQERLNIEMAKAAEPVIEKALDDIETEMRKKLGGMIVGFLDSYMEVERMGQSLRILVKHDHT